MSQTGSAKLNQLMFSFGTNIRRPTCELAAHRTAKLIKTQWAKDPRHLQAVAQSIGQSINEITRLMKDENEHPTDTRITYALIEELVEDPPEELIGNQIFKSVTEQLAQSIGKSISDS